MATLYRGRGARERLPEDPAYPPPRFPLAPLRFYLDADFQFAPRIPDFRASCDTEERRGREGGRKKRTLIIADIGDTPDKNLSGHACLRNVRHVSRTTHFKRLGTVAIVEIADVRETEAI